MKKIFVLLLMLIGCSLQSIYAGVFSKDTLYAAQLKPMGRTTLNQQKQLELITSAAHFGFSFTGAQCAVYISIKDVNNHNYFQYELDGVYQKNVRIDGSSKVPVIIKAKGPGIHTVRIYKTTEAASGAVVVSKIAARNIKSLPVPKLPIIEFIGNSITCGAAADASEIPCGTGDYHDHHNAYMAYGPRVARTLNAEFVLNSVSGIGVYRTWNRNTPSMPLVYENTDLQVNGKQKWNFAIYSPKIVSIALGTNDMSNGDGSPRAPFDTVEFVNSYVKFVQLVKLKYPKAQIALLGSPMIKGASALVLQRCLSAIKQRIDGSYPADKRVAIFLFNPITPRGCSGHPSVDDHRLMAEQLSPFFKRLLK